MRKFDRAYLLVATLAAAGCVLLLLDKGEYAAAEAFRGAVECGDTSSDHCYQLYPGVIQAVRVAQTSSGEQDPVDIASRGTSIHVSLLPSAAESPLLKAGAAVRVEWYVGSVATVWIGDHAVPSTANLAAGHADFAYIGWTLVWLATLFWAIVLLNRRMLALFAAVSILPTTAEVYALSAREVILPGGTGWVVRSRPQQAVFLPLVFAALVLISVRPLMNQDLRLFALTSDALLFGWISVRLFLTFRNSRLVADHASIAIADWIGRMRTWPVAEIQQVAVVGVRWTDWEVPALLFVGKDGTELFRVTSLFWNLDEVGAVCLRLGIPLSLDYVPTRPRHVNRARLAMNLVVTLITGALLAVSFIPPPS